MSIKKLRISEKKSMTLLMGTKKQFKMYLDEDLVNRLKVAADRVGKDSGQVVAEEILSIFLPVWSAVNDSMRRAIEYHSKKIIEDNEKGRLGMAEWKPGFGLNSIVNISANLQENPNLALNTEARYAEIPLEDIPHRVRNLKPDSMGELTGKANPAKGKKAK